MKKNVIMATLILGVLINGWAIAYLALPFYYAVLLIAGLSLVIMTVIHERFVFLYAIAVSLVYGGFLTTYSFVNLKSQEVQLLYMYDHLLLTSFLLLYWILMNSIKKTGYENVELQRQVQLLQKYTGVTKLLTLTEFNEQAQWLLTSTERNKEEVWLVKIDIHFSNKRTKANLQEDIERLALQTIRQKFDLITSNNGVIYVLLKNTHAEGAQQMIERFKDKTRNDLNFIDPPFSFMKTVVENAGQLASLVGRL
ncbi:hypothetical protein ACQKDB_12120 [Planococcus kocurii]|uniref:GGDEF domain-containing protein n=1 Tax=Planococcus faecalis TaxID=1598147 RepID=A0ABN4XNQ6_9BACL|nr:hypothetical protein [Planococcus faecalis]AQU80198.1 hypothetical protein AJGP001_13330 [Planococcus faecalis]